MEDASNHGERIGKLETAVAGIDHKLDDMTIVMRAVQNEFSKSRKTDWSVVWAGALVAGALWAAAIRPVQSDVERTSAAADNLAKAVVVQNDKQSDLSVKTAILQWRMDHPGGDTGK